MHEPQSTLPSKEATPAPRRITFVPPTADVLHRYAYIVCQQLEEQAANAPRTELLQGFAHFIKTVVTVQARALNGGNKHDQ